VIGHAWQEQAFTWPHAAGHATHVALRLGGRAAAGASISADRVDQSLQPGDDARLGGVLVHLDLAQRLLAHDVAHHVLDKGVWPTAKVGQEEAEQVLILRHQLRRRKQLALILPVGTIGDGADVHLIQRQVIQRDWRHPQPLQLGGNPEVGASILSVVAPCQ